MKTSIIHPPRAVAFLAVCLALLVTACSDDETTVDLRLAAATAETFVGETVTVDITSGNNGYTVTVSPDAIATATVSGQTITITGKAKGTATVTVVDEAGRTATIDIVVKPPVAGNTPRFKWTNTIELDKANNWSTAILSGRMAVTNITERKQYILSWTGGFTVGEKTNAMLRVVERGRTTQEIALTSLELQRADDTSYALVFNKDAQSGELVVTR